jgi:putative tryptophan/tyrosine transport system substrate-binding protein
MAARWSYGNSIPDAYRRAGNYVAHILKGAKPADQPVQAPTKCGLVINLKTAKVLRLEVSPAVLGPTDFNRAWGNATGIIV